MTLLQSLSGTPLAIAIGWTLLHSLWQGIIIAAALALILLATKSAHIRYSAAMIAIFALLAACVCTLAFVMPQSTKEVRDFSPPGFPAWMVPIDASDRNIPNPLLSVILPWLAPLWFTGVWIFYLRSFLGWFSISGMRKRGVCSPPQHWQQTLSRLCTQAKVSRPVQLLESALAGTPMVLGHLRPVILMPIGLIAGLPAEQIEAILLHELAHIRRNDFLMNVLQRAVEGLLFYHPAVWWISRIIRQEREHCCDDQVVAMSGDAHTYVLALATVAQNRSTSREPAVAATGGSLVKRVRRLLYPEASRRIWTPLPGIIILIATAALTMSAWQPPQQSAQAPTDTPYMKWLNEDVVYIINDTERAAFLQLKTDEERQQFIEQFWLRRDPTPQTEENEMKEEHYRRIAYANERFRTPSAAPGWKTDRGHMYIIYGPPDEIESHPAGSPPREEWLYKYVEGVGTNVFFKFIDRSGSGDFRLVPR